MIALDRPGYGFSDPVREPSIRSWCDDMAEVAAHLEVTQAAVVGYSLGALYALGCALWLPHLVTHVALVSPLPPRWDWPFRRAYRWRTVPRVVDAALGTYIRQRPSAAVERLGGAVAPSDKRKLEDPSTARSVERTYLEMLRRGSAGWAADDTVAARCDMPLGDIGTPVTVWRGAEDRLVPAAPVDELIAQLPHGELRLVAGSGHLVAMDHADELLASLRAHLSGEPMSTNE